MFIFRLSDIGKRISGCKGTEKNAIVQIFELESCKFRGESPYFYHFATVSL